LKEQQWKLPFASAEAHLRDIHETVRVPAEVVPKAGTESIVAVPIGGRYESPETGMPGLGSRINEGDLVGYIELLPGDRSDLLNSQVSAGITLSRLSGDVARAEAVVAAEQSRIRLVEKEAARVKTLVEAEALPEKRLDEVHSELEIRRASLEAAKQSQLNYEEALARYASAGRNLGLIQDSVPVYAPISGQLVQSSAVGGQYVNGGEMLFRIVDLHRVWVEGKVFEQDLHKVNSLVGGTLELPGLAKIALDPTSLVTIGSVIDSSDRTLPIVFEVENRKGLIKLGSVGRLDLMSTQIVEGLAVPRQAVLLEENRSVVYVQLEGETFERRLVKTGLEDSEWVQVIEGLEPGERIVTVGAYDVALAGRSTEVPVHGHVH
jgi:RND family efflux transporter MFP subunit